MSHFLRYFLSSVLALALDYGITAGGIRLGWGHYAALLAGTTAGAVCGFLLLTFWVFPARAGRFSARRTGGYALGIGLVYAVRAMCVWAWNSLGLGPELIYAGLFLAYGCSFLSNFLFQKYVVFAADVHSPAFRERSK